MDDIQAQGQGGFTLIELLVVVSIIGILAATSIGSYDIVKTQTKYANSELTLAAARTAMEAGKAESDTFTTTMSAWQNSAGPMTSSNARRIARLEWWFHGIRLSMSITIPTAMAPRGVLRTMSTRVIALSTSM